MTRTALFVATLAAGVQVPGAMPPQDRALLPQAGGLRTADVAPKLSSDGAASREPAYSDALITGVPHVRQKPDFCGEAAAESWLAKVTTGWSQDAVFARARVDPAKGRGAYASELARALTDIGFDVGEPWHRVPAGSATALEGEWAALHADLIRQVPSIVCMHYDDAPRAAEHFRLVLGYDAARDEVVYHEPAEANGAYRRMSRRTFLALWPLKYERERWTVIRMRLAPVRVVPGRAGEGRDVADLAQHVMKLKDKIAGRPFTVAVEPPFVVVGDEAPDVVRRRAARTVRWTMRALRKDFFEKDPSTIDVWLFKDKTSYEKHALELFGDRPTTPYGYYSSTHGALVMNIGPGAGTLVHEMVHPYMHANVPDCPPWLNEGLASLYERATEEAGHIRGEVNWRLPALQSAIRSRRVPTFEALAGMDETAFYEEDEGTNYAQARYLCFYLQERGLLVRFFRRYLDRRADDPTGYATLREVLGEKDMQAFQRRWEAFVLELSNSDA